MTESETHQRSNPNIHPIERAISVACGVPLAFSGMRRGVRNGKLRMAIGAELLRRGLTGSSFAYRSLGIRTARETDSFRPGKESGVHVRLAITIGKPRVEVFAFWRDLTNLPQVMLHLKSVEDLGGGMTRWTVEGPLGKLVRWDAAILHEIENERISWCSMPGASVENSGMVRFADAPRGFGTEVTVELRYSPPAGPVGAYASKLFGRDAVATIEADCWRLKQYLETGEVATIEGQSKGGSSRDELRRVRHIHPHEHRSAGVRS